jgi:hypothetical protein
MTTSAIILISVLSALIKQEMILNNFICFISDHINYDKNKNKTNSLTKRYDCLV